MTITRKGGGEGRGGGTFMAIRRNRCLSGQTWDMSQQKIDLSGQFDRGQQETYLQPWCGVE